MVFDGALKLKSGTSSHSVNIRAGELKITIQVNFQYFS